MPTDAASLLRLLDLVGVGVFGVSGALTAGRKSLDLLGVVVLAVVTAVGGGTIRDLLLGQPVFWVGDPIYLVVIVMAAAFTVVFTRFRRAPERLLLIADALGLALFTVSGAQIAERSGASGIVVVIMGAITGSAGGVIRDVLCSEIPLVLRGGRLYATAALAGAAVYHVLHVLGQPPRLASGLGMTTVAALRFGAILFGLKLPVYRLRDGGGAG